MKQTSQVIAPFCPQLTGHNPETEAFYCGLLCRSELRDRPVFIQQHKHTRKPRQDFERKEPGLTGPPERQVSSLHCPGFGKGQNSDERDAIIELILFRNTAWHNFISVMHNLKLLRERR